MRVLFNGRIPAFQAGCVGSIPITRSKKTEPSGSVFCNRKPRDYRVVFGYNKQAPEETSGVWQIKLVCAENELTEEKNGDDRYGHILLLIVTGEESNKNVGYSTDTDTVCD